MKKLIMSVLAVIGLFTVLAYGIGVYNNWTEEKEEEANWNRLVYVETASGATEISYFIPSTEIFEVSMNDAYEEIDEGLNKFETEANRAFTALTVEAKGL